MTSDTPQSAPPATFNDINNDALATSGRVVAASMPPVSCLRSSAVTSTQRLQEVATTVHSLGTLRASLTGLTSRTPYLMDLLWATTLPILMTPTTAWASALSGSGLVVPTRR
ncbi:hypothetical protein CYMTET_25581 [Cymbomonas tetramitiformis]|uniref:Uncharacterized protein n=1 Tax=Cymbomonas tetramitiformis TaxID=36881 RepID=A0AAE0KZ41_9CHLO|nr:hypothetical protein CYMTET_25581 [Cymbomonas tetramitiformis]